MVLKRKRMGDKKRRPLPDPFIEEAMRRYTITLDGQKHTIKTKLNVADLKKMAPMAFHGKTLSELGHLDKEEGFWGHFVIINFQAPDTPTDVQKFLDMLFNGKHNAKGNDAVARCIEASINALLRDFAASQCIAINNKDDILPMILISRCSQESSFDVMQEITIKKEELIAAISLTKKEIGKIIEEAVAKIPEGQHCVVMGRLHYVQYKLYASLAQKIIDSLI